MAKPITPKKTFRNLDCHLNDEEVAKKSDELVKYISEYDAVDEERKEVASEFRERLKAIDSKVHATAKQIEDRTENKRVACLDTPDFGKKLMVTTRSDKTTDNVVETRPLLPAEMQGKLIPEDEDEEDGDGEEEKAALPNLVPIEGGKGKGKGARKRAKASASAEA